MSDHWFWKKATGETIGPITTKHLHEQIKDGLVEDEDHFRIEDTEDWLPATQIKSLFLSPNSSMSASQIAANLLAAKKHWAIRQRTSNLQRQGLLQRIIGGATDRLRELTAPLLDRTSAAIGWVVEFLPMPGKWTAVGLLVVVTAAIVFRDFEFDEATNEQAHAQLSAAWAEMESLWRNSASESEWQQFNHDTRKWLSPQLSHLQERARAKPANGSFWSSSGMASAQARRDLLCATECLARILDAPQNRRDSEDAFYLGKHLQNAHGAMTGDLVASLGRKPVNAGAFAVEEKATNEPDSLFLAIVMVDAVALSIFVAWLVRRRRVVA